MSSPKVEKAVSLIHRIEATRAELASLEREFEDLISPARVIRRRAPNATREAVNGKKTVGSSGKALGILKNAGVPVKAQTLKERLKLSKSGISNLLSRLIEDGKIVRTSYGHYA